MLRPIYTQLYFTTKCDSKNRKKNKNRTELNLTKQNNGFCVFPRICTVVLMRCSFAENLQVVALLIAENAKLTQP